MKKLLYLMGLVLFISCQKDETPLPSPGRMIKQFKLEEGQYGAETIYNDGDQYKVMVRLRPGTDLNGLTPQIRVSDGATISPASNEKINVPVDHKYIYKVTSAAGIVRSWEVEFRFYDPSISDYGVYSISSPENNNVVEVQGDLLFNLKYLDNAGIGVAQQQLSASGIPEKWQEWHIISYATIGDVKYYQIRSLHSGKLLTAPPSPQTQLIQSLELSTSMDTQLWQIAESTEAGKYEIKNKQNGMYLTLANSNIVQQSKLNNDSQLWDVTALDADSYRDDKVVNFFNRTTGSVAFDQGTSIPLANGKVLWITQDAWYQESLVANGRLNGNHFISYSNSIIIQQDKTNWNPNAPMMTATGAKSGIGNICPAQPGMTWSWPGVGVEVDGKVYLQCGEGNGLTAINQSLYELTPDVGLQWTAKRTTPAGMTGQVAIGYAAGMVKAADGFVYCFGSRSSDGFGYVTDVHVARFPSASPQSWTFWNGTAWISSPTFSATGKIADGLGTNAIAYLNGKYIHLTMDQGFNCGDNSRNIYISTSVSPTGPFSNKKLVYNIKENYKGYNARYYTPAIHPQGDNGKNELLITYCLNYGSCPQNDVKESDGNLDPYYYRVKGVRIPYELIGL